VSTGHARGARPQRLGGGDHRGGVTQAKALDGGLQQSLGAAARELRVREAVGRHVRYAEPRARGQRRHRPGHLEHAQHRARPQPRALGPGQRGGAAAAAQRARRRDHLRVGEQRRIARELLERLHAIAEVQDPVEDLDVTREVAVEQPPGLPRGGQLAESAAQRRQQPERHAARTAA